MILRPMPVARNISNFLRRLGADAQDFALWIWNKAHLPMKLLRRQGWVFLDIDIESKHTLLLWYQGHLSKIENPTATVPLCKEQALLIHPRRSASLFTCRAVLLRGTKASFVMLLSRILTAAGKRNQGSSS